MRVYAQTSLPTDEGEKETVEEGWQAADCGRRRPWSGTTETPLLHFHGLICRGLLMYLEINVNSVNVMPSDVCVCALHCCSSAVSVSMGVGWCSRCHGVSVPAGCVQADHEAVCWAGDQEEGAWGQGDAWEVSFACDPGFLQISASYNLCKNVLKTIMLDILA